MKSKDLPKMNTVVRLTNVELLAECLSAAEFPAYDPEGNDALLAEVRRRGFEGLLEAQLLQLVEATLGSRMPLRLADHVLSAPDPAFEAARQLLQVAVGDAACRYLFHGTLKSRLSSIQREGLIPARRAKSWGRQEYSANAASGVFFTIDWRRATNWVGPSAYDAKGIPVKGAVIRLPAVGVPTAEDKFSTSGGSVVVRLPVVSTKQADVLLPPFSIKQPWLPINEAVEMIEADCGCSRGDRRFSH